MFRNTLLQMRKNTRDLRDVHHRRARSIGGSDLPENKSLVKASAHKNWHILFGTMNAFQICGFLNRSYQKPKNMTLVCRYVSGTEVLLFGSNGSSDTHKRRVAWDSLFKNMSFSEIIVCINQVWIDPVYQIEIKVRKVFKSV